MSLPERRPDRVFGEVMKRLEIEIRPENPALPNGAWRVYLTDPRNRAYALRRGGYVLGGSMRQAFQDAEALEAEGDFFFKRPEDADGTSSLILPPGVRDA